MVACEPGGTDESSDEPGPFDASVIPGRHARLPSAPRGAAWLVEVWEQCRLRANESLAGYVLVLDEIQELSNWSAIVKGLWDADRASDCPLHVVILGSAPLQIQAGLNESLMGRFEPLVSPHWSFTEMASAFGVSLDEYVLYGGYPGSVGQMAAHELAPSIALVPDGTPPTVSHRIRTVRLWTSRGTTGAWSEFS